MRLWIVAAVLVLLARVAAAHQSSVKYVDMTVDGARAHVRITVAPSDVTEPLGLVPDSKPSIADASVPAVAAYVARWIAVGPPDAPACLATGAAAHADADARFVAVEWDVSCSADLARVALDLRPFFALDQRHEAIVTVHAPGDPGETAVVRANAPQLVAAAGESASAGSWIAAGVDAFWEGREHVAFLLALLLVTVLARGGTGWESRTPRAAIGVVAAFTVASALSLIAASLGWVRLPAQAVEILIATSIVYAALEDLATPAVRWRSPMAFAFGLVHGLGFASALAPMLPPDRVATPLACFELGVVLGQLAVVAVALPLLWLLCRELGARRYRRVALPILSTALALVAIEWIAARM